MLRFLPQIACFRAESPFRFSCRAERCLQMEATNQRDLSKQQPRSPQPRPQRADAPRSPSLRPHLLVFNILWSYVLSNTVFTTCRQRGTQRPIEVHRHRISDGSGFERAPVFAMNPEPLETTSTRSKAYRLPMRSHSILDSRYCMLSRMRNHGKVRSLKPSKIDREAFRSSPFQSHLSRVVLLVVS
jgi:hypothetical protein